MSCVFNLIFIPFSIEHGDNQGLEGSIIIHLIQASWREGRHGGLGNNDPAYIQMSISHLLKQVELGI